MAKATLKDIAVSADVSESTASRALARHPAIAEVTRKRVWSAAAELGYTRHLKRVTAQADQRRVVGVVVAALNNSFYPYLVDRIHNELDALGYEMILIVDELSNNSGSRKIQSLIDTALDGVIFTTATIGSPVVDMFVDRGIPVVLAIRSNRRDNTTVIESDNRMAGREAAQYLLSLGHRRFGAILGPRDTSTALDRFRGYQEHLEAHGTELEQESVIWGHYSHESGYSNFLKLADLAEPPTALFCANDVIAIGALDAARKIGIAVPEQISIMGVDDIPMASWSMIDLTTIRQPLDEIAIAAARRLINQIETGPAAAITNEKLPTSLIRRSTTASQTR